MSHSKSCILVICVGYFSEPNRMKEFIDNWLIMTIGNQSIKAHRDVQANVQCTTVMLDADFKKPTQCS